MLYKDINCGYLRAPAPGLYAPLFEDMRSVLGENNIAAAAVYNYTRNGATIMDVARDTLSRCEEHDGLTPVINLMPPVFKEESFTPEQLTKLINEHSPLFRIRPSIYAVSPSKWMYGELLELLERSRSPLLVSVWELGGSFEALAAMKAEYPGLPLVLTNTDQWYNRQIIAFCKAFPNTYMDTTNLIEYEGVENYCELLGAEKIIFGSGMPYKEPYDKMFQLMFSEISEEEKQLIAYKNYDRLLEGRRKI